MRHPVEYLTIQPRVFVECGQCGGFHHRDLPGQIDCRDDAHRFIWDELDDLYDFEWEEITLEEQERNLAEADLDAN